MTRSVSRFLLRVASFVSIAASVGCADPAWQEEPRYGWLPEQRRFGRFEERQQWDRQEPLREYLDRRWQDQDLRPRRGNPYGYRDGECDVVIRRRRDGQIVEERGCPDVGYSYGVPIYPSRPDTPPPYGDPRGSYPRQPYGYAPQQQPLPPVEGYRVPDPGRGLIPTNGGRSHRPRKHPYP
jgi:hypothetical protein